MAFGRLVSKVIASVKAFFPDVTGDLPAFEWTLNQREDDRAIWQDSRGNRTDHFHFLGNKRILLQAGDGGHVSLLSSDRGPTWLNAFDPERLHYGGGFSYVHVQNQSFATAFDFAPSADLKSAKREYGVGLCFRFSHSQSLSPPHFDIGTAVMGC